MMNISELLTSLKMDLGIYGLALPFPNPDQTMMDVIKLKTLKVFSPFQPHNMKLTLDFKDLKCLKTLYTESIYEIPDVFGDRRILYVKNIQLGNRMLGAGYVNNFFDDSVSSYQGLMMTQANANLASLMNPAFTFKFEAPNLLYLYNVTANYGQIIVEFSLEHSPTLSTISPTVWLAFYELAVLDLKMFLFNTLKHYNEIQTAYGSINLKIDDWSGAEGERKDMLEKWRDLYHIDVEQFMII